MLQLCISSENDVHHNLANRPTTSIEQPSHCYYPTLRANGVRKDVRKLGLLGVCDGHFGKWPLGHSLAMTTH